MPPLPVQSVSTKNRRARFFWPGIAFGVIVALATQLAFMFVSVALADQSPAPVEVDDRGTAAMISANIAGFVGAAAAAIVTHRSRSYHHRVAATAYVAWSVATLIMIANVASTTHALG